MATHIAGTVQDASSAPLPGVVVRVHRRDTGAVIGNAISGVTTSQWSTSTTNYATNYTERFVLAASQVPAATQFKVTIKFGLGDGTILNKMYIGEGATSGSTYAFATTPTPVLFAGSASVTGASMETKVSDLVSLVTDGTKNIVISIYYAEFLVYTSYPTTLLTGWTAAYREGDDAATVAATGYSSGTSMVLVNRLDMYRTAADGAYDVPCGSYTGEVQVVFLDPDGGTLHNDVIHRTYPVTI